MPVPKPLPKKAGKKTKRKRMGEVMHELKGGPHHQDRTHEQEVAIAAKSANLGKKKTQSGKFGKKP